MHVKDKVVWKRADVMAYCIIHYILWLTGNIQDHFKRSPRAHKCVVMKIQRDWWGSCSCSCFGINKGIFKLHCETVALFHVSLCLPCVGAHRHMCTGRQRIHTMQGAQMLTFCFRPLPMLPMHRRIASACPANSNCWHGLTVGVGHGHGLWQRRISWCSIENMEIITEGKKS